jgi:MFS family permease
LHDEEMHKQCLRVHVYCPTMASLLSTPAPAEPRWSPRTWGLLIVLCGVLFLDGLDVSMVGVALPSIEGDLHLSTSSLQWIVSGYVLGYGGFLLLGGRTADLFGRRRVLFVALAVFAGASLLGGLVNDGDLLVATRFLKGVAAAFTAPAGLSIITTTFHEGPQRNKALSIYAACGASGFSMGLVLGGLLTTIGWRWTFLVPVPIAVLLLAVGPRVVPHDRPLDAESRRGLDLGGALTVTAAMLLLVRTVVTAPDSGWASAETIGAFAVVVALLAAFVAIERRSPHPLVRLGILRNGPLVRANLGAMALFGSYVGFQFVGTLYMQSLLGWSALQTALAFLPAGLIVAFGAPRVGRLADRIGTAPIIAAGALALAAGYALFLGLDASPVYAVAILPTMVLIGIGFGLSFPSLNMQATSGVADHEQGVASGLVNTSFQVGGAVVLAVVSAVVTSQTGAGGGADAMLDGFRPAVAVSVAVAVLGLAVALTGLLRHRAAAGAAARA